MPMTMASILSRPCLSGLRLRPRRLFGFDGTTDADPRSPTGSITPGPFGPASATAPARIADPAIRDLQGPTPNSPHPSPLPQAGYGIHTLKVGGAHLPPPAREASGGEGRLGQSPSGVGVLPRGASSPMTHGCR